MGSGHKTYNNITTYIPMINFLFLTVLPPGASKVGQIQKFEDFLDFAQSF